MTTRDLFALSEKRGYIYLPPETAGGIEALSVLLPSGNCAWTAERGEKEAEYRDRVSHEIGHCEKGGVLHPPVRPHHKREMRGTGESLAV